MNFYPHVSAAIPSDKICVCSESASSLNSAATLMAVNLDVCLPFAAKSDPQSLSMLDPSKLVLKPDTVSNFDKPQYGIPFRFSPFFPGNYEGRMLKPKSRNPSAYGVRPPLFPLSRRNISFTDRGHPPFLGRHPLTDPIPFFLQMAVFAQTHVIFTFRSV